MKITKFMPWAVLLASVVVVVGCGSSSAIQEPGPTFESLSPSFGALAGGTPLTIKGTNLTPDTAITLGELPVENLVLVDDETITCTTPAADGGTNAGIIVSNANGQVFELAVFFYVPAPVLTSASPDTGKPSGGVEIILQGRGFTEFEAGPNTVMFEGIPATNVVTESDVRISCMNPAGLGPATVTVTNLNGVASLPAGFRYFPPPTLSSVSPAEGTPLGGTPIVLTGSGFTNNSPGAPSVTIGLQSGVNIMVVDDTTITCDTPPGPSGAVPVTVLNGNGSATIPGGFDYYPGPTLTAVSPGNGLYSGGTAMTLTGSGFVDNFAGAASVDMGGGAATSVMVVNDTTITCISPTTTSVGPVDVSVTNANGTAMMTGAFTAEIHLLVGSAGQTLYSVSTSSGATTTIGPIGTTPVALAVAPDYQLYGITSTTLLKINLVTGAGTTVGALTPATAMDELSFKGARLIGVKRSTGQTYEINTATGAVTTLAGIFARKTYFAIGGPTGGIFKNGFEYDGSTFYYLPNESFDYVGRGDGGIVYNVNPDTGAKSDGGLLLGAHAIMALAYFQGTMYGIEANSSFSGGSPTPLLVTLNLPSAVTSSTVGSLPASMNTLAGTP